MAIVMPRSRSSGALSIWSKAIYLLLALALASTLVMAAVRVVLPWSTCPIVPTFTCGFVRSNFFFAITGRPPVFLQPACPVYSHESARVLCWRIRALCALASSLDQRLCDVRRHLFVMIELHRVGRA